MSLGELKLRLRLGQVREFRERQTRAPSEEALIVKLFDFVVL